jgi:flagellar motor switch protein FliG
VSNERPPEPTVDPDALSGPQRVAAFLLSLDRDAAASMLKHLSEDVVTEVVEAMASVDSSFAGVDLMKRLHGQVAIRVHKPPGVQPTTADELDDLLVRGVGKERAALVLQQIQRRRLLERPFAPIELEPPSKLARLLENESPASMALVLAHLDPHLSAVVLGALEVEQAMDVVRRMATLTPPSFDVLHLIAQDLKQRIASLGAAPLERTRDERYQTIADMLNLSGTELGQGVMEGFAESETELATSIREHMFSWNDIATIDRRSMQKILGSVDTKTLSIALKAAAPDVEQNITENLSSRVKDMVREERELAGAMPMSEVVAARDEIMKAVRALIEAGEFQPAKAGDELVS